MKLTVKILVTCLIVTLVGCSNEKRQTVLKALKDPDSTKWYEDFSYKGRACLVINSKNAYGGYAGKQTAWLQNLDTTGGANWILREIDDNLCYQGALEKQVASDEAEKAFEAKVVGLLNSKGLYTISGSSLPYSGDDPTDACLLLAGKIMTSYRIFAEKTEVKERAWWKNKMEEEWSSLESGKCKTRS